VQHAIDIRRFPWIRRLASDYASDHDALATFFAGDPAAPDAWRAAIAGRSAARPPVEFVDVLVAQLESREAPAEARASAESLRRPDAVAVVTGQQAGLFGGPLFTLLKALTTLQLAARVSREHGVPTVPVFWIDAEDHDWDEVAACAVLDTDWQVQRVALAPPPGAGEAPVGTLTIGDDIGGVLDALTLALPPTEFTAALVEDLRRSYQPGSGMADAFGRWLETVLGSYGLVVFDSSDPAAKPFARDLFERELRSGRTAALASEAGHRLAAQGYHAQVTPADGSIALFRVDGERQPIRRTADGFTVGTAPAALDDLVDALERTPDAFGPNVLLRPLMQDTLFPTVCYVPGPSELAYLAQLKGVYEHFALPMPLLHPRDSATLLDSAGAKFLDRHDLPFETLQPQDEAALNRLLEAQLPPAVEQSINDAREAIRARLAAVVDVVPSVDPTLAGAAKSTLGRMEHDLKTLHNKILQAAKRRDETLRRQFTRARAQAFPDGHPQERALGFVGFLNRFGPSLIDRLLSELPLDPAHHSLITP
jgi:bacillithiol biosynthesis cysteine-adding enzyme BshC|tara:strand:+ start:1469 stop:3082 length:1614 start_codon:yes stop_codon:yes gene_type:complete